VEIKGYKKVLKSSVRRYFEKSTGEQRNNLPEFLFPVIDERRDMLVFREFSPTTTAKCGWKISMNSAYFPIRPIIIDFSYTPTPLAGTVLMRVIATGTSHP
jgi:hypothetical protein